MSFFPEDNEIAFVVVMISHGFNNSIGIEPLGVYSSLKNALSHATELESCAGGSFKLSSVEITFDVLEYQIDKEPLMLGLLKKRTEEMEKELEESIIKLMKRDIIDQLIGEDGNFYYTLTEKGEKEIKNLNLPRYIYKLLKRKK